MSTYLMKLWCTLQMIMVKILSISQSAKTFRATGSATSTLLVTTFPKQ